MYIEQTALVRRLTPSARRALEIAVGRASSAGHFEVTPTHVLSALLENDDGDVAKLAATLRADREPLRVRIERSLSQLASGNASRPAFGPTLWSWFQQAWLYGSLELRAGNLRTGHLFFAFVVEPFSVVGQRWPELTSYPIDELSSVMRTTLQQSPEAQEDHPSGRERESKADDATPALTRYCLHLSERARRGEIDPVLGRQREIRLCVDVLCRRRKNNPIVIGEPGVGKSAVVEGLALAIAAGEVPSPLDTAEIYTLDLGALSAGTAVQGEFEKRLKAIIDEVLSSTFPIVLFVDEAHTLIGAGGRPGGADAANLIKPALARGELRMIAATTWSEYKKHFERDAALARRFQPVKVDEPAEGDAIDMLRGIRRRFESAHGVQIDDAAVVAAVTLSNRYLAGRRLPDKAIDVLDTAAARTRIELEVEPADLAAAAAEVGRLEREAEALGGEEEKSEEFQRALHGLEVAKHELAAARRDEATRRAQLTIRRVTADDVARTISSWSGIPIGRIEKLGVESVLTLRTRLQERVRGQDEALAKVAEACAMAWASVTEPTAPAGVFLFVGPSGVGKTETALALADELYGGERFVTQINMGEYQERHSVSRLIGSPPGYVGYGEGGVLTEAVRRRPYSVVLLDECEKAYPEVLNLFYQVFDRGTMNDGEGRAISFRNTICIMTSNLASDTMERLCAETPNPSADDLVAAVRPALTQWLKPALLARITVIPYRPIGEDTLRSIAQSRLERLAQRVRSAHAIEATFDDKLIDSLLVRCSRYGAGARSIDHVLRESVAPAIANTILTCFLKARSPRALRVEFGDDGRTQVVVEE